MQKLFLSVGLFADNVPELPRLDKVPVGHAGGEGGDVSGPRLVRRHAHALGVLHGLELGEHIVRVAPVVAVHGAGPVAHVRRVHGVVGPVGRELEVVWAYSVSVRVWIAEHSGLEDWIWASWVKLCFQKFVIDCVLLPGSAEGPIPGTMFDGEKHACSISWK